MQSLEKYRAFYVAAKYENFSQAAEELFVSQSSVSQAIRALEQALDLQLFRRIGKKVRLSEEGTFLFKELGPAFERISRSERMLHDYKEMERGTIRIGASDTLCRHYLLESFARFRRSHPKLSMELINAPSPEIASAVENGSVDIGFVIGRQSDYTMFHTEILQEVEEVFFTSPHQTDLLDKVHSKNSLRKLPFVSLREKTSTRRVLDKLFAGDKETWRPHVEVISIDLMIDLVACDFGISFSHRHLVEKSGLVPLQVDFEIPTRQMLLLKPARDYESTAVRRFCELILIDKTRGVC